LRCFAASAPLLVRTAILAIPDPVLPDKNTLTGACKTAGGEDA
jgi:hypothetical protein